MKAIMVFCFFMLVNITMIIVIGISWKWFPTKGILPIGQYKKDMKEWEAAGRPCAPIAPYNRVGDPNWGLYKGEDPPANRDEF